MSHSHDIGKSYPVLNKGGAQSIESSEVSQLRKDIAKYTQELKFLLEQRDTEIALSPTKMIRVEACVSSAGYAEEGFIAYSVSSNLIQIYTSVSGWVDLATV